jgi:hypothetical protein
MQKRSIAVATVVVVAVIVIGSLLALPRLVQSNNPPREDIFQINFTDQSVYIFGHSQNTMQIEDRLLLSTSNVTLITNVSEMANLTGRFILFVDGDCFDYPYNCSIGAAADAVRQLVLNGTPVVVLDRDVQFLALAMDGTNVSVTDISFTTGGTNVGPMNTNSMINGVRYYPDIGATSCWSIDGRRSSQFDESITSSYNWADEHISNTIPET